MPTFSQPPACMKIHPSLPECRVPAVPGLPGVLCLILGAIGFLLGAPSLEAAAAPASSGAADAPGQLDRWIEYLGRFHMLVLHYPIGFLTAAVLLELYGLKWPNPSLPAITRFVLWLSLAGGIAASALGLFRASGGGFDPALVNWHRNLGLAMVAATALTLFAQHLAHRQPGCPGRLAAYRALLVASIGLLVGAGHYGGNLTHGSDFLTANPPALLAGLLPGSPPSRSSTTPPNPGDGPATGPTSAAGATPDPGTSSAEGASLYASTVAPALKARCYSCHGPEKQRGDYRLDQREHALKGGESGIPAITPGEPLKSNLMRLILLPEDHDDVMPPEGKKTLTPDEVLAIARWIHAGAPFDGIPATP